MKKLFAILLVALMLCSLAACDGNKNTTDPTQSGTQVSADAQKLEATLWTLSYDKAWVNDEEAFSDDEEYSAATLYIPEGEDSYVISAEISASVESPENFRDYLSSYGFDAYEYAENNAYDLVNIGGVDCLKEEGNYWGDPCLRYFGRVENANATVMVLLLGDYEDARVEELLAGLTFNLTDIGNVDCPWPWNGEPFSAEGASVSAGSKTLKTEWIPFEESVITTETFEHKVEVVGDKAYVVSDGIVKQYAFDGSKLTYEKDLEFDAEYEYISADKNGNIWLSKFAEDLVCVKDGEIVASYEDTDNVVMSPDGKWGVNFFTSSESEKITVDGDSLTREAINFAEVDTLSELFVDDSYIYVCGYAADDSGFKVFVYDTDGKLVKTLCDEEGDSLGSITYIQKTSDGFIGIDGNMRDIILWDADGKYVADADADDLFSTGYPWLCDAAVTKDGKLLVIITDDRADESAKELVAFTLGGF